MEVFFGQTDFAVRADDAGKPLSDDSGASTVTVAAATIMVLYSSGEKK